MIAAGTMLAAWLAIALAAAAEIPAISTPAAPSAPVAPSAPAAPSAPPAPPTTGTPAASGIAWRQLAPGARSATLEAGGITVLLVQFDLARFRAEVVVGEGTPPRAQTASDLRVTRKAVAAVNGGFFDERISPLGLRIASGKTRVGLRARVDWGVLVIWDRHARIIHSRDFRPDPDISAAIQVGPRLVVDGVPLKLKPQAARRTAVALDKDGRLLTLVVVERPIQAGVLAARLAAFGVDSALMLDGGPSTQLSLAIGVAHIDAPGLYPVPDLLAIFSR